MFDQLELLVDPKAQKKFNQARKKRKKNYGQDYWVGSRTGGAELSVDREVKYKAERDNIQPYEIPKPVIK